MKTKIGISILAGMLCACDGGDVDGSQGWDSDRMGDVELEELGSVSLSLVEYVVSYGSPFSRGGNALSPFGVRFTDEQHEQFEVLVPELADHDLLSEHRAILRDLADRFNDYDRGRCVHGVTSSSGCRIVDIYTLQSEAFMLHISLNALHGTLQKWTMQDPGLVPDPSKDDDWMITLSPEIRLAMAMDLVMQIELYELSTLPGSEIFTYGPPVQDVRDTAQEYYDALGFIEHRYPILEVKYGPLQDLAVGEPELFDDLQDIVLELTTWNPKLVDYTN